MEEGPLKNIIKNISNKPGVYQYYNTEGTILYVGKAKNLKKEFLPTSTKTTTTVKQLFS